jgi:hypothetical protein
MMYANGCRSNYNKCYDSYLILPTFLFLFFTLIDASIIPTYCYGRNGSTPYPFTNKKDSFHRFQENFHISCLDNVHPITRRQERLSYPKFCPPFYYHIHFCRICFQICELAYLVVSIVSKKLLVCGHVFKSYFDHFHLLFSFFLFTKNPKYVNLFFL